MTLRPGTPALAGALLTATLLSGCGSMEVMVNGCPPHSQQVVADTFFFGTRAPNGIVSEDEWQNFLTTIVTPRFPRGLTWWRTHGQWLDKSGKLTEEDCFVLHIIHDRGQEKRMREIRDAYAQRFRQEAVLRERSTQCVSW
ncbi:MAG TPA: DUF3574 domain-containing protein [Thermoanaerobaculia bacterium]|nr:DUF3574 domain-containing protein [Thermoanaerobaculia bacterium]